MKYILLITLFFIPFSMFGQNLDTIDKSKEAKNTYAKKWLKELTERGIEIKGDSVIISEEYKRAIKDTNYRKILYPKIYSWEPVAVFIKKNNLKPAFWYLINLYSKSPRDKEIAIKFLVTYERLFLMDEMLISTFYTYSFMDPETSDIVNGELQTIRPDLLEDKLRNVNEMVAYILEFREQKKLEANKN